MLFCNCCGTEISNPQFYNGFAYGYTCIKKVAPSFKRKKVVVHQVKLLSMDDMENRLRGRAFFKNSDGEIFTASVFKEGNNMLTFDNVIMQKNLYYYAISVR